MTLDELDVDALDPEAGEVQTTELVVTDDVLVKAFALGPDATVEPHEHDDCTNVFQVLQGRVTVIQDDTDEELEAPAVVHNERGVAHGARNDTGDVAVFTASLCPLPGSG